MVIEMKYDISTSDAFQEYGTIKTEIINPVMLNMELCIEKDQYVALKRICTEYKTNIVNAIIDLLNDDPEKLIEQYM